MTRAIRRTASVLLAVAVIAIALPFHSTGTEARGLASTPRAISAGYYNALPGFDIMVSGQHFTPSGRVDVLILELGHLRAHDVITATVQGTFTDKTALPCDFHAQAITAYDRRSGQWSNQALLGSTCPG